MRARQVWGLWFLVLAACGDAVTAQPPVTAVHERVDPAALGYVTFPWPASSVRARSVALGCAHVCVLEDAGRVACWGRNEFGELADGTLVSRTTSAVVAGLPPVVELAAGCAFTCARTESGDVWCWGGGDLGEIGDGDRSGRRTHPVRVPGIAGARSIAASGCGACASTSASGGASCWGTFDMHPGAPLSGDETRARAMTTALREPASLAADSPFRACVIAADGTVSCWGARPVQHVDVAPIDPMGAMPGIAGAHDLGGGSFLTCASDAGGVWCWDVGVVSFGLGGSEPLPPVRVPGIGGNADLAVGDDFVCATIGDETRCAGYGELVDAAGRVHPLGASFTRVDALARLRGIVANGQAVCGIASGGVVRCVAWLSGHEGEPPAPPS